MKGSSSNNFKVPELPILLLSIIKIDQIHNFLRKFKKGYKEKFKFLKIFHDLSQNEPIYNCSKNIEKILLQFKQKNMFLSIEEIYRQIIINLNKEMKNYDEIEGEKQKQKQNLYDKDEKKNYTNVSFENEENNEESLIEELFIGDENIETQCLLCSEKSFQKKTIIIFSFDLANYNNEFNIENAFKNVLYQDKYCNKCKKTNVHQISKKITKFPKIFLIILNNYKHKENKINFKLQETYNNLQYNLISFIINNNEIIYKNHNNIWNHYKIGETEELIDNKDSINEYNPIIFFYQIKSEDIKNQIIKNDSQMFITNHNFAKAILNYKNLKEKLKNNIKEKEKVYLIFKSFFKDLFEILGVDLKNLNNRINDEEKLNNLIRKNKIEIFEMNFLKVINNIDDITEDIDFVNENILNDLGVEKDEFSGKDVELYKIGSNIFQIKLKDNTILNLTIKNGKQIISIIDNIKIIYSDSIYKNINKELLYNHEIDIDNFYQSIIKFTKKQESILDIINNNKINEKEFNEYYITNKNWFIKVSNIFESDDIYNNEQNIKLFKKENTKNKQEEKKKRFRERMGIFFEENLFKVEFEKNNELKAEYPKKFIIINIDDLKELYANLKIPFNIKNDCIYAMILGEKYIFIKDNKDINRYFVCRSENEIKIVNNVEIILRYKNYELFSDEVKNYIKDGKGLDNYLKKRNLDISKNKMQFIKNEEKKIGFIININYANKDDYNKLVTKDKKVQNLYVYYL